MSTQTSPNAPGTAVAPPPSHHWVISLKKPGVAVGSWHSAYTPPAGATRQEAFQAIKDLVIAQNPPMAGAVVIFFSLEPNLL
ncbi:hypothetical protein [Streptomyces sp. NBC_00859]|uniref:hypothetical protein n=1 Tax=Streptomyces sp. NBC_00859 TaxID=2903682 RepID=UPI0038661358|nr:hypothetical protein OG584_15040 [Streptomyces sp. NBC_00859]